MRVLPAQLLVTEMPWKALKFSTSVLEVTGLEQLLQLSVALA